MVSFKYLSIIALAASASAQAIFGAPENSAAVLKALQVVDKLTITSGQAAQAFTPNNYKATAALTQQNELLLQSYKDVLKLAESSLGFYSDSGAQAIIDFVTNKLYPDTNFANNIYRQKRPAFVQSGFINFINPALILLRGAVDGSSAAVQAKTRAAKLTPITVAFTLVEQSYADVQEFQQFG